MFNLSALASNVLSSMDNVVKETLEDTPKISATRIRKQNAEINADSINKKSGSGHGENDSLEVFNCVLWLTTLTFFVVS